jgi:aspartate aminotransferase-like enzyme
VAHLAALAVQLERVAKEGLAARFARHAAMAARVRAWAEERFALFAEPGYRSETVTAVSNPQGLDLKALLAGLKERGFVAASGYGRLKESTFRIGHMGDVTLEDVEELLAALDEVRAGLAGGR